MRKGCSFCFTTMLLFGKLKIVGRKRTEKGAMSLGWEGIASGSGAIPDDEGGGTVGISTRAVVAKGGSIRETKNSTADVEGISRISKMRESSERNATRSSSSRRRVKERR